jgi:hypothetical protein
MTTLSRTILPLTYHIRVYLINYLKFISLQSKNHFIKSISVLTRNKSLISHIGVKLFFNRISLFKVYVRELVAKVA